MKKTDTRYILIIVLILVTRICTAQISIGIQTVTPEQLFHVDAADNNQTLPAATRYNDDVVVDKNGNMGIGTHLPQSRLHIKTDTAGKGLVVETGTAPTNGHVLVSDNMGIGKWEQTPEFNQYLVWKIHNPAQVHNNNFIKITGTVSTLGSIAGSVANADYTLTIPKGTYLILANADINYDEYATFEIRGYYVGVPTIHTFVSSIYQHYLSGTAFIVQFTDIVVISMHLHLKNNFLYGWDNTYTFPVTAVTWGQLTLIRME